MLLLEVADELEVRLRYEREMLVAWRVVHQRLQRRTLCYRLDELAVEGSGRAVDERWLEKQLRLLIEASKVLFDLGLDVARRCEVDLAYERGLGAERREALLRMLESAVPATS